MLKHTLFAIIALFTFTSAHAGLMSNQDKHLELLRGQLVDQLNTPALVEAMQTHGISRQQAEQRLERLSQKQLAQLSEQIDNAPAGSGFITWIVIGFAIVAVTDALGFTDLFPFIKGPE